MDAEQRSVFQGIVYYYRENMVNCRYQVTLKDAVDGALLQQALDAAPGKGTLLFPEAGVGEKAAPPRIVGRPLPGAAGQCKARISGRERLYCCPEL